MEPDPARLQGEIDRLTGELHAARTQVQALLDAKEVPIELKKQTHVGGVMQKAGTIVATIKLMSGMSVPHLVALLAHQTADIAHLSRTEDPAPTDGQ